MSRTALSLILASIVGFGTGAAHANECLGINFPDQAQSEAGPLVLNGVGVREATVFKVNVYVAALYLSKASNDAGAILAAPGPYELILHFVRNVDSGDIDKGWAEGFDRNAHGQLPVLQERIGTLSKWMTDIKTGQRLQFSFKPGVGLQVTVNGVAKGTISGDDFAKAFLSIWLGVPPNGEVRAGMLGGKCD
jgi:hypothetical protein